MKNAPKLPLLFLIIMTIFPAIALRDVQFDNSALSYAPTSKEYVKEYLELRKEFGNDEAITLLIAPPDYLNPDFIEKFYQSITEIKENPFVERVHSIFSLEYAKAIEDEIDISPLVDYKNFNNKERSYWEQRINDSSMAKGLVLSRDKKKLTLTIVSKINTATPNAKTLKDNIYQIFKNNKLEKYIEAEAGALSIDVRSYETSFYDLAKFLPISILIAGILIWLLFPGIAPLLIALISINSVSSFLMALYGVFNLPFNIISTMVPTLITALGIASIIHLYNAIQNLPQNQKNENQYQIACKQIQRPCLFAAITTGVGFLSLSMSEIPPIRIFGILAAIGSVLIYFVTLYIVPPILKWKNVNFTNRQKTTAYLLDKITYLLFKWSIRHSALIIIFFIGGILIMSPKISTLKVETSLLKFFNENHIANIDTKKFQSEVTGTSLLEVIVTPKNASQDLKNIDILNDLELFRKEIEKIPSVERSLSYTDILKELHWAFNESVESFRVIPQSQALIDQYLFIYDGKDLFDFIKEDFSLGKIQLNISAHEATKIMKIKKNIESIYLNVPRAFNISFSGHGLLFANQEKLLVTGQIKSLWLSILIIFILMYLQWKNFSSTILTMIPNILPLISIFILMAFLNIWLDMGTALIASVTIGIAVDDTIHLYNHIHHGKLRNPIYRLAKTYKTAGKAIISTTIVLCSQFLILALSSYVPTRNFAILTSLGLFVALIADLLLLPAIIMISYQCKNRLKKSEKAHVS